MVTRVRQPGRTRRTDPGRLARRWLAFAVVLAHLSAGTVAEARGQRTPHDTRSAAMPETLPTERDAPLDEIGALGSDGSSRALRGGFTGALWVHAAGEDISASERGFDPDPTWDAFGYGFRVGVFLDPEWSFGFQRSETLETGALEEALAVPDLDASILTVSGFCLENWRWAPWSISLTAAVTRFETDLSTLTAPDGAGDPVAEQVGRDSGIALEIGLSRGWKRWERHRLEFLGAVGWARHDGLEVVYGRLGIGYRMF